MKYRLELGEQLDLTHEVPVIYDLKDRMRHFYICGASGTGKSVFMERMAEYDLNFGLSVIYIDPKGESVKKLYQLAKNKEKIKYVSKDNPLIINPLSKKDYSVDNMIDEFVRVLDVLIILTSINPESSVRMKSLINMAVKSFSKEQINFKYLCDFLNFEEVRKYHKYPNAEIQKEWREFDVKQGQYYVNREHHITAKSIVDRLKQLINHEDVRPFITGDNELNIPDMLRNGESLLVDTSGMSSNNKIFISNLIFHSVTSYIFYDRLKIPLLVYIDEFQRCASDLIRDILEFGRGEQVGFVLAHHDFSEFKNKDLIKSVTSISNNYAIFRCGEDEDKYFFNTFKLKQGELKQLDDYEAWIRLKTDNIKIETYPPKLKDPPDINFKKELETKYNFLRNAFIPLNSVL